MLRTQSSAALGVTSFAYVYQEEDSGNNKTDRMKITMLYNQSTKSPTFISTWFLALLSSYTFSLTVYSVNCVLYT